MFVYIYIYIYIIYINKIYMLPMIEKKKTCLKLALSVDQNALMGTFINLHLTVTRTDHLLGLISVTFFFAKHLSTFLLSLSFCLI